MTAACDDVRAPALPRVCVYDTLRTAHLERAGGVAPTTYVYRHRSYDWDDAAARHTDARRLSTVDLARLLLRHPVEVLEVNEPLMRPGVLRAAVACLSVSLAGLLRRRRTLVVTYAIDNRDPYTADPVTSLRSRLRRGLDHVAARIVWRRVDRVAYGTPDAQQTYRRALPPLRERAQSREILHLPVRCDCLADAGPVASPPQVVFVGALAAHKGVPQLLAAWPTVRERVPAVRLHVLGKGELETDVRAAAELDQSIVLSIDPPRAAIHEALRHSSAAVLFSQPRPRWREQVGLPIVEALAHGCGVVTSGETGLAPWLSANGHSVLPADASATQLASAIATLIVNGRSRSAILASLPATDGRAAAEQWLFRQRR